MERPNKLSSIAELLAASKAGPASGTKPETVASASFPDELEPKPEPEPEFQVFGVEMIDTECQSPSQV